jgi:hypothetical protein
MSLALHAAVLTYHIAPPRSLSPPSAGQVARSDGSGAGSKTIQVQLRTRPGPEPRSTKEAAIHPGKEKPATEVVVAAERGAPSFQETVPASALRPILPMPTVPIAEPEDPTTSGRDENESPESFDGSAYLPRSQLSTPPAALAPIALGAPKGEFTAEHFIGVLSVFIDEEGKVRHVTEEGATLPVLLGQAAREAFEAALFSPGQAQGRPVKSRLRVEVVFDNTMDGGGSR